MTSAVDCDDGCLVAAPEFHVAERLADQRRCRAHDRFEERVPSGIDGANVLALRRG
jgi:hypothetical protein